MIRPILTLLILALSGCMSSPSTPGKAEAGAPPPAPVLYRDIEYALDDGGTLKLHVGTAKQVRTSDWGITTAWPVEVLHKHAGGQALMRMWIDQALQQVRRETPVCIGNECHVSFDYVPAGTPAPPMLVPSRHLGNLTWTEEDTAWKPTLATVAPNTTEFIRYGTEPSRAPGWAWTGWQGTIEYDDASRPQRIDLTTIMPGNGKQGAWRGTLARAEAPQDWTSPPTGASHQWTLQGGALAPWFPGFDEEVPGRDFSIAEAHQYVLDEHDEARQAHAAACTVKVGLGLVDSANSTVTPLGVVGGFFESNNTQVSFGFPQDGRISIWAIVHSESDTVRPERYEEGGSASIDGSPRCEEFGTRSETVDFFDFVAWAQLAAHQRLADSVHISWHDTAFHGRLATGTHMSAAFGPVDANAQVSASFAVVYYPVTGRLGGGLMPATWVDALDATSIPKPIP